MNEMTSTFYTTMENVMATDERTVVILGVSGVGICVDLSQKFPGRFIDAGIMEQSIIGIASGLSTAGLIPIIYGQSTFMIERAYEQLKIDFGYQKLGGNFVVYGGSTEFGTLGATHCCPAALSVLSVIPGMEIVVPGRPDEFRTLFLETYDNDSPTVYRTSMFCNTYNGPVSFGRANVVKKGSKATVLVVGPMLELAMRALQDEDVTILYYTTVAPFDAETLCKNYENERLLLMEPAYQGGIMPQIAKALQGRKVKVDFVGYPHEFITNHGYVVENASMYGLTVEAVKEKYRELIQ